MARPTPAPRNPAPARWREPTSTLPLRWGRYDERLVGGLMLIVSGTVAVAGANSYFLPIAWSGLTAAILGWSILPAAGWRRTLAAFWSTIAAVMLLSGPRFVVVLVVPYLCWLLVRHRPARCYPLAVVVVVCGILIGMRAAEYRDIAWAGPIAVAIVVACAWLARELHRRFA